MHSVYIGDILDLENMGKDHENIDNKETKVTNDDCKVFEAVDQADDPEIIFLYSRYLMIAL